MCSDPSISTQAWITSGRDLSIQQHLKCFHGADALFLSRGCCLRRKGPASGGGVERAPDLTARLRIVWWAVA